MYSNQKYMIYHIWFNLQVPVYYLNADFDYWNMLDWKRPDIDCLHTVIVTMTTMTTMTMTKTFSGGTCLANAWADDHLPANPPLHFYAPRLCLRLCILLWISLFGQIYFNVSAELNVWIAMPVMAEFAYHFWYFF